MAAMLACYEVDIQRPGFPEHCCQIVYFYLLCLRSFVAPPDEKEVNGKIWIEFDDGDSGFFQLDEIRRIHPNFPAEGKTFVAALNGCVKREWCDLIYLHACALFSQL
mgnify:CR=1 FL=1